MPQIEQVAATWASQLFWLAIAFGLVFFVIGLGMVPKVQGTVDARDKSVADDLAAAEAARAEADATEAKWRAEENAARATAQAKIAASQAAAIASTEQTLAAASATVDAKVHAAEARIADASRAALGEIETVAADLARDIVTRLSGAPVAEAEARQAVQAVLHG